MVTNKIACIGAGYWGKNLVRNFTDLGALAWVCESDPLRRAQLAAAYPTAQFTDVVDQIFAEGASTCWGRPESPPETMLRRSH
jgi:UDP-2-acetamido-3-amino-2,3-dideoxy-glucuronate N-acetyltransferase